MEYWIDGHFIQWWSEKSYFSHDRQIFIPIHAVIKNDQKNDRIYIEKRFAQAQMELKCRKYLDWSDKKDANLGLFVKALNVPWEKEPFVEPEEQFKVSLP